MGQLRSESAEAFASLKMCLKDANHKRPLFSPQILRKSNQEMSTSDISFFFFFFRTIHYSILLRLYCYHKDKKDRAIKQLV